MIVQVVSAAEMTRLVGTAGLDLEGNRSRSSRTAAKNPKKRKARPPPDPDELEAFVDYVKHAVRHEQVVFTEAAQDDLDELDITEPAALMELRNIEAEDFLKRVRSHRDPDEDVWVFLPPIGVRLPAGREPIDRAAVERYWIRLVARDELIVVSFHEA